VREKTPIDIETLLLWAYRDELSKRQTSAAEGLWDQMAEQGQRGGMEIDRGHSGGAQRYAYIGLPDPDALLIEKAASSLEDLVIDWDRSFEAIAAELAGLVSVNDVARRNTAPVRKPKASWGLRGARAIQAWYKDGAAPYVERDSPRDVLLVGGIRTAALVTMHAVKGTRPDWIEESPRPFPTPARKGTNAAIFGECKGKNLYSLGAYCPLRWTPSPISILSSRADYVAWHHGLATLARTLRLEKFAPLPPKASLTPWRDSVEAIAGLKPVMPAAGNNVSAWGTLPLAPLRDRKGPPLRSERVGPVRYPLTEKGAAS
jgi:hypothetical protein